MKKKAAPKKKSKSLAQSEVSLHHSHPVYFLLFLAVLGIATVVIITTVISYQVNSILASSEITVTHIGPRPSMMPSGTGQMMKTPKGY